MLFHLQKKKGKRKRLLPHYKNTDTDV